VWLKGEPAGNPVPNVYRELWSLSGAEREA